MSDYQLGQRVRISGTAVKAHDYGTTVYREGPLPSLLAYPEKREYDEGVIVGNRTTIEGEAWSDDNGRNFSPNKGTAKRVWLIAFEMRRKPVMCFDHQVAAIATGPTVNVPAPHVPYPGPHDTDATFMRGAAKKIAGDYPAGGSNVKRAVIKLLNDTADAMEAQ